VTIFSAFSRVAAIATDPGGIKNKATIARHRHFFIFLIFITSSPCVVKANPKISSNLGRIKKQDRFGSVFF
jgi:hypothetical protein